jgi:hypothetical protein
MAEIATTYRDAKVSICVTPTADRDLTSSEYAALTWVVIEPVVTVPAFSVEEEMQTRQYVNQLGIHMKGAKVGQTTELVLGRDTADAGYNAIVAASKTSAWYPMRIELADSPNPTTTTNTREYALVLIGRASLPGGGANDDILETFPLAVQSEPVIAPPTAITPPG